MNRKAILLFFVVLLTVLPLSAQRFKSFSNDPSLTKEEVRAFAAERGFVNSEKRESQDICLVPDGDYAAFMERYTGKKYPPGDFIDTEGRVLGRHRGAVRYTLTV